ncbi:MAG: hypothetical protein ABEI52_12940, partial [Halobacteriaceae archaeon]
MSGPRLGIVGDIERISTPDDVLVGPDDVANSNIEAIIAVGTSGLRTALGLNRDLPILPVDIPTLRAVSRDELDGSVASLKAGDWVPDEQPVYTVDGAGLTERAFVLDVTLMTRETARISEYYVETVDRANEALPVTDVRADGVVVATPAGSTG